MDLNFLGVVSAVAAFLSIWWGHVIVRKVEATSVRLSRPMLIAFLLGMIAEGAALLAENIYFSSVLGIIGVVFLWDAFEFYRQQKRVMRGHAPANPNNPRHAQILQKYPEATTIDWLDRAPRGSKYSAEEIAAMKASSIG